MIIVITLDLFNIIINIIISFLNPNRLNTLQSFLSILLDNNKIFKTILTLTPALRPCLLYNVDFYKSYIYNTGLIDIKVLLFTFTVKAVIIIVTPVYYLFSLYNVKIIDR